MKKKVIPFILILTLIGTFFCGCSKPTEHFDVKSETPQGYIHARGIDLVLDGKTIVLKGVNAGGWLLTEDWLTPTSLDGDLGSEHGQYELEAALAAEHGTEKTGALFDTYRDNWWTQEDFQNIAEMGFNLIRLPFGRKECTDENGVWKKDAFSRLDWFVEQCAENRLFVVLDLHGAYGSQNGRHHSGDTSSGGDLYGNETNENLTLALWKGIAAHYKNNKWVAGYDLLNEPEGTPGGLTEQAQWDFYDRLYREIRTVDEHHLLFMESCWDANHMPDPHDYGWENVAYEYHYYNWDNGNDLKSMKSYFRYKEKMERKYNRRQYRVPVFIGEFTFFDNLACWRYGLDFFEKHGMSWAMWTYKGCVDSNWVLYGGYERTANTVITPYTDYDRAMAIAKSVKTDQSFAANEELITLLNSCLAH